MSSGPGDARRFAKRLRKASLVVDEVQNEWKIWSPGGQLLGAYGASVMKGSTHKNILAQIKRETGISA